MSRTALITGASRGLGRCVALELVGRGYGRIGLGCRTAGEAARAISKDLRARGVDAVLLSGDLGDSRTPQRIVSEFLGESREGLDVLVNNAGYFKGARLPRLDEAEWDRQIEINLSAAFRMMRAAGPALSLARGAVINVSSVCGFSGAAGGAPYSAAKAGLEALTRAAAVEWGEQGIRVNALIPGFMHETDMGAASTADYFRGVLALSPLGKPAIAQAAACMIAELAELEAVTGQVLSMEGRVGSPHSGRFKTG